MSPDGSAVVASAAEVWSLAQSRPPTLGPDRLICVDGPAASGKTTLASGIAALGAQVVHMDDLYEGWQGLPQVDGQLTSILRPLERGEPGSYRHFDWAADRFTVTVPVAPTPVLVVEGVGSGSPVVADLCTVLVWVEAPPHLRLERGMERDGEHVRERWLRWMDDEAAMFERHGTRARADLVVWTA